MVDCLNIAIAAVLVLPLAWLLGRLRLVVCFSLDPDNWQSIQHLMTSVGILAAGGWAIYVFYTDRFTIPQQAPWTLDSNVTIEFQRCSRGLAEFHGSIRIENKSSREVFIPMSVMNIVGFRYHLASRDEARERLTSWEAHGAGQRYMLTDGTSSIVLYIKDISSGPRMSLSPSEAYLTEFLFWVNPREVDEIRGYLTVFAGSESLSRVPAVVVNTISDGDDVGFPVPTEPFFWNMPRGFYRLVSERSRSMREAAGCEAQADSSF